MGLKGRWCAAVLAVAAAGALLGLRTGEAGAGNALTPGLAAGGVPLSASVQQVETLLGPPSNERQDPSNPDIYIQRWEALCLDARYTPQGALLALDVWADLGGLCPGVDASYSVEGTGGRRITFRSTRSDVERAFGDDPDRVLRGASFTVLVYDDAGIAFYIREAGDRTGLVDAVTVFPRDASRTVWAPRVWGQR